MSKSPSDAPASEPPPPPRGFRVGHWTDPEARTGCTVVLVPPGSRGGVDVRGGGTGTRELENLAPLANAEGPSAVLFTGGSAFGLAAADGVMRWLEERGIGRPTPAGPVPLVPTAVMYDLTADPSTRTSARPGPESGYEACSRASEGVPQRGSVGAGTGAAVGKLLGRDRATRGGAGYAAAELGDGTAVAVLAVANSFGDVLAEDGAPLGSPRGEDGALVRTTRLIRELRAPPATSLRAGANTTLVCVCTDASLDKRGCGIVARIASGGIGRAVEPAYTPIDGDVVFCIASGSDAPPAPGLAASWQLTAIGALAADLTAAAIRDGVRQGAASA